MIKRLPLYPTRFEEAINKDIMYKTADKPLVDFVIDSWKSLQILEGIEFLDYKFTEKMSEIEINKFIFKRTKGRKKSEKYDYKFIEDSRLGLLTVRLKLTNEETDFTTNKIVKKEAIISKSILIPIQDEDGFYFIKGKRYYLIYQLVEKSTYTSNNAIILKSLMPFLIRRKITNVYDVKGNEYNLPYYTVDLFNKDQPVMLIYASKGLDAAIQFALDIYPYLVLSTVTQVDDNDDKHIYFQISSKLYLKVRKDLFEEFSYVQSVVGGILEISSNRLTTEKINDENVWIKKLSQSNIEKGKSLLNSLKRLMDETTKKIIRTDLYNKMDVLTMIRYLTQEFNEHRQKDNMNLANKRLRCNEYPSSLLTQEFSKRLNRIMSLGSKATIDNYKEIFKFSPEILIQRMHASGIFRYDDNINDMDVFSRFKMTTKGPHAAGEKNKNSLGITYRSIHPSMIGYVDMTVCGNSD